MKSLFKVFLTVLLLANFYTVSADLVVEKPTENEKITSEKYEATGTCDNDVKVDVSNENQNSVFKNLDVKCENGRFKTEIDFTNVQNGKLVFAVTQDITKPSKEVNIVLDLGKAPAKVEGYVPNKDALVLKRDPRVKGQGEEFETEKKEENKEDKKDSENKTESQDKKEEIIEVTLENGNKFSHRKLSCELPQNVRENLNKDLTTNFIDISNSKFVKEIKNLENLKVVVGTSKNTFENREISKLEFLGLVLKANCYDVSTSSDWREKVLKVGLENKIIDSETFKNNKNISKKEAFEMILKGGKTQTPKIDSTESMKYLGVFKEDEKVEENLNLFRDEAVNILVNIIKLYQK